MSDVHQAAMEDAPFVIFSKTAPSTLPAYDVDKDFTYFYFNRRMDEISGLCRDTLANSIRNAKMDFPEDFEQYFRDDAQVVMESAFPAFKAIVEPWSTPAMSTINHTRKTGVEIEGSRYMLGCFTPFDDVHIGVTRMRHRPLPPALEPLQHVAPGWYEHAFMQLPLPVALFNAQDLSRHSQNQMEAESNTITTLWDLIRPGVPTDCSDPKRSICELHIQFESEQHYHVFAWRVTGHPLVCVAVWGPLEPLPTAVAQRLHL